MVSWLDGNRNLYGHPAMIPSCHLPINLAIKPLKICHSAIEDLPPNHFWFATHPPIHPIPLSFYQSMILSSSKLSMMKSVSRVLSCLKTTPSRQPCGQPYRQPRGCLCTSAGSLWEPCGQPFLGLSHELDVRVGGHGTNFLASMFWHTQTPFCAELCHGGLWLAARGFAWL